MLQQVWPWLEFLCCDKIFLCSDRVGQGEEDLGRDMVFLGHDRFWPWMEFLCCDKIFLCRDRVGHDEEKLCLNKVFCVATEFGLGWGFPYRNIALYVAKVGQGTASRPS